MIFKDIKQNYPVYILNKQDMTFSQGKVISTSFPRYENRSDIPPSLLTSSPQMVIDITI